MFIPYRCEDCINGISIYGTPFSECPYDYDVDDNEDGCEERYEDDEEI